MARDPLRGAMQPTDKEQADVMAIGGLRNTADSLNRLTYVAEYGVELGEKSRMLCTANLHGSKPHAWP